MNLTYQIYQRVKSGNYRPRFDICVDSTASLIKTKWLFQTYALDNENVCRNTLYCKVLVWLIFCTYFIVSYIFYILGLKLWCAKVEENL